jgi:hypothetical protein
MLVPQLIPSTLRFVLRPDQTRQSTLNWWIYALPSWSTKVKLGDQLSTLDNGSEVNMMLGCIFEGMYFPIDMEIHWQINAYDTDRELEVSESIGVCHDVPINHGGITVK